MIASIAGGLTRRTVMTGAGVVTASGVGVGYASIAPIPVPTLTHVFDLTAELLPAQILGAFGGGLRRVIPIAGGTVSGPRLRGNLLPGGADWQTVGDDGVSRLVARYTIECDDGTVVSVINTGVRRVSPEIGARMAAGEAVDPALYYFRSSPTFEVCPGAHRWLSESVFVCSGERRPADVVLRFYQVN